MRTVAGIVALVPLVAACAGMAWLIIRVRANPPAPPRPDEIRARFGRLERQTTAQKVAGWMLLAPLVVPGLLLGALADGPRARFAGVTIFGSFVAMLALSSATGRSGRVETVRARPLARSEAFWSQPDAEERARAQRR